MVQKDGWVGVVVAKGGAVVGEEMGRGQGVEVDVLGRVERPTYFDPPWKTAYESLGGQNEQWSDLK